MSKKEQGKSGTVQEMFFCICAVSLVSLLLILPVSALIGNARGNDTAIAITPDQTTNLAPVSPMPEKGVFPIVSPTVTTSGTRTAPAPKAPVDYTRASLNAGIPVTAPVVIDSPGHYLLTNDLVNSTSGNAIRIRSSDVFIEGAGHSFGGASLENTSGIYVIGESAELNNITVVNLTVTGWAYGINFEGIEKSTISDCYVTGNREGISIAASSNCTVINSTVWNNIPWMNHGISMGGSGMVISDSFGTRITKTNISDNGWGAHPPWVGGYGIYLPNSSGSLISGCVINKNINTGIWSEKSKDVTVLGNEIHYNTGNGGVFMTGNIEDPLMNGTVSENTISGSGWGIWLSRKGFSVMNNTVSNCGSGILLDLCQDATLERNVMESNSANLDVEGMDEADYRHRIDTSNTVDGRPVYYLVNKPDAVVDSATNAGIVYAISCKNLTVEDLVLRKNVNGIFLRGSDGAVITNVTSTENEIGFALTKSDSALIDRCTGIANSVSGFLIEDSEGVQVTNSDAVMNTHYGNTAANGITLKDSTNVTIQKVNASFNEQFGIELDNSDQSALKNTIIDTNEEAGIVIHGDSLQISGCRIRNNRGPGIGMLDAGNLTIWNNYLSNDENIGLARGAVSGASWNVNKTAGTNIVGGLYLGGNYWADPDGTGWSQITPDRGDGFCNAPFVFDTNNTDYLPLHLHPKPPVDYTATGIYRNGLYYLKYDNSAGPADMVFTYGTTNDKPVTGHWNGDVVDTPGVYRNGMYYLRNSNSAGPAELTFAFGMAGDIPVTGDWIGDGTDTIGTYRNGVYYLRYSNTAGPAELTFAFGTAGDIPVTGDWDGDGITTIGTYRNSVYYLRNMNGAGNADLIFAFGTAGDIPVTGDWNGDGITTIGVYRNGVYYLRNSNSAGPADLTFAFGTAGDIPVTGKWI